MSKSESAPHRVPPYKRPIIIIGFLIILAVAVVITILAFKNFNQNNNTQTHLPSSGNDTSSDSSTDLLDDDANKPDKPENKAPQYEGEDPNSLSDLTGTITYKDIDTENQILHSAVNINQYLQNDGQCVFNLRRDDAVVRTTSAVAVPDVTTTVCGPFSISIAGLSGTYQIEIIMTGDGKRGVITDEIQI